MSTINREYYFPERLSYPCQMFLRRTHSPSNDIQSVTRPQKRGCQSLPQCHQWRQALAHILHPGELLAIIGGIVTLTAFYNLPFLVSSSFATTGKELASKSWHLTTQGWQLPANESGMRWLLWLMVLFVLMMIIVSALRLLGIVSRGERTSRLLLISGGAAVLFLLVGFFTQYAGSLVSGFWLGSGFLLALVSTIVLAIGGYLEVRPYLQM